VQELLQLGFIDPVTSASAGKQCVSARVLQFNFSFMSRATPPSAIILTLACMYFDKMALQISEQMSDDVCRLGGALPLIDLCVRAVLSRWLLLAVTQLTGFAPTITRGR
jgi:hypothetical protein